MKPLVWLAVLGLAGCERPERSVDHFVSDPEAAARVVADCDAGRETDDCAAARRGLAEARRQARMRAYERAF